MSRVDAADRGVIGDDEVFFKERRGCGGVIMSPVIGHVGDSTASGGDCGDGKEPS